MTISIERAQIWHVALDWVYIGEVEQEGKWFHADFRGRDLGRFATFQEAVDAVVAEASATARPLQRFDLPVPGTPEPHHNAQDARQMAAQYAEQETDVRPE